MPSGCKQLCVRRNRAQLHEEFEVLDVFQCDSGSFRYAMEGVVCDVEFDIYFICQSFCQASEQCAATCEPDAVLDDVIIVPSKAEYKPLLELLQKQGAQSELADRKWFATQAFGVSSHYDTAIHQWFAK